MRRVLIVNPPALASGGMVPGGSWCQPGLISLWSALRAAGVPVEVLDLACEVPSPRRADEIDACLAQTHELLAARRFDLLAISCNSSFHYLAAADAARWVRQADETVTIVAGGCHASAAPRDFETLADVVVRGDGEVALVELARRDRPASWNGGALAVVAGPPFPLEVDAVDLEGYPYRAPQPYRLLWPLSRGCPYRCAFCAGADRGRWRAYPPAVAVGIVRRLLALGPECICLSDACFGLDGTWRRAVLEALVDLRLDVPLELELRADLLTPDDVSLLGRLDVRLDLGVETLSPRMAEAMRKARDGRRYVSAVREALGALQRAAVLTQAYVIVNHPGETPATVSETLAGFKDLVAQAPGAPVYPTPHAYLLFPGTPVAEDPESFRRDFGTQVAHPRWWTGRGDQYQAAKAVRASSEAVDVEDALGALEGLRKEVLTAMPARAKFIYRMLRMPVRGVHPLTTGPAGKGA